MKTRNGFVSNSSSSSFIVVSENVDKKHKTASLYIDDILLKESAEEGLDMKKINKMIKYKTNLSTHEKNIAALSGLFSTLFIWSDENKDHYVEGYPSCIHMNSSCGDVTPYTDFLIKIAILKDKINQEWHVDFDTKVDKLKKLYKIGFNKNFEMNVKNVVRWYYSKILKSNKDCFVVTFTWRSDGGSQEEAFLRCNAKEVLGYNKYLEWNNS